MSNASITLDQILPDGVDKKHMIAINKLMN